MITNANKVICGLRLDDLGGHGCGFKNGKSTNYCTIDSNTA
jgi:hypothetical protein